MHYYTHHKHMGSHHCVYVYGLSDCSCNCMPYYTHQKHRALITTQFLISYQTALLTECHITYFTVIKVLPNMFAFMPYQTTRHCKPYYTHHKNNGPHHCVCVSVLSYYSLTVCIITHITNIMALTTVCICGLSD